MARPVLMRPGPDAGRDILLKSLVEGATLTPVEGEHRHVLLHAAERGGDHALRNAGGGGFGRDVLHKSVEVAAAARGKCGAGASDCKSGDGKTEAQHGERFP